MPDNRVFSFHGGAGGTVLSKPKISYDLSDVRNVVEVLGPEPKGPPKRIRAVARAAVHHPLSPEKLGRNGEPRWLVHRIDADLAKPDLEHHAKSKERAAHWGVPSGVKNKRKWRHRREGIIVDRQARAERIARRELDDLLTTQVEVTFDSLVVPHLEEGDRVAVHADGLNVEFRLRQFSIPLTSDGVFSVGTNKRVSWRRRKKGHRR